MRRYSAVASVGIKPVSASADDDDFGDDVSKLCDAFLSTMATRAAALHAFERQFFSSLVANLRRAESFFFDHVTSLRRSIHDAVTSRDAAAARALKVFLAKLKLKPPMSNKYSSR
jgi:hypothetical protein